MGWKWKLVLVLFLFSSLALISSFVYSDTIILSPLQDNDVNIVSNNQQTTDNGIIVLSPISPNVEKKETKQKTPNSTPPQNTQSANAVQKSIILTPSAPETSNSEVSQQQNIATSSTNEIKLSPAKVWKRSDFENKATKLTLDKLDTADDNKVEKWIVNEDGKFVKRELKVKDARDLLSTSDIEVDQPTELTGDTINWNVQTTNAPNVWNLSKGGGIKVAILDSGIANHTDLTIAGKTSVINSSDDDILGHGTGVAGVLSAILNNDGIAGVAPEVSLYSVKITDSPTGSVSDAINGLQWAIDNNMSIVVMSFGFLDYSQFFKSKAVEAYNHNILLIAAAGNNQNILYPAKYDEVIAVGGINDQNQTYGATGTELELVAPAVSINTTGLSNTYQISTGTSLSAPAVAGIASLYWAHNTTLTNTELRGILQNSAKDLGAPSKDSTYGYGEVYADLTNMNVTIVNPSYNYTIYQVVNYKTENQTRVFWTSGNGSWQDVTFSEGLYFIETSQPQKFYLNVSNNGTFILLNGLHMENDYYSLIGTNYDSYAIWGQSTGILMEFDPSSQSLQDFGVVCWSPDATFTDHHGYCFGRNTGNLTKFLNDCPDSSYCEFASCTVQSDPTVWYVPSTAITKNFHYVSLLAWNRTSINNACDSKVQIDSGDHFKYEQYANTSCFDSTGYTQGFKDFNSSPDYLSNGACSGSTPLCNGSIQTSSSTTDPSPCVASPPQSQTLLNATLNTIAFDRDGEAMGDNYVYVNDIFKGKTDNNTGQFSTSLQNIESNILQNVSVYCYNNQSKLCGSNQTFFSSNGQSKSLLFDCTICKNNKNMYLKASEVGIVGKTVSIPVHIDNVQQGGSATVSFKRVSSSSGLVAETINTTVNLTPFTKPTANVTFSNVADGDYIYINLDPSDTVSESQNPDVDNFVIRPYVVNKPKVYLNIKTGSSFVDQSIFEFLTAYVQNVSEAQSEIRIGIGSPPTNQYVRDLNDITLRGYRNWGYKDIIIADNKPVACAGVTKSKNTGLVGSFVNNNNYYVFAYGSTIEGTIASVKRLIDARKVFLKRHLVGINTLYLPSLSVLDQCDTTLLSSIDLLKTKANNTLPNTAQYKFVTDKFLNNNNYEQTILTVKTTNDNTTLRLKHANTDFSLGYQDAVLNSSQPVVLSRGIHNNLFSWDSFGQQLASSGFDTWQIEMMGGPTIDAECNTYNCPNYTFNDLKTYYWPALISGVQRYSGKNNLSYVGFSMGCTAALGSMSLYQSTGKSQAGYFFNFTTGTYQTTNLSANAIDTFVGLACPGNFQTRPFLTDVIYTLDKNSYLTQSLRDKGKAHVSLGDMKTEIYNKLWFLIIHNRELYLNSRDLLSLLLPEEKLSVNIYSDFVNWMDNTTGPIPGADVNVNKFMMIQGNHSQNSDSIVPNADDKEICANINSNNKYYLNFNGLSHAFPLIAISERDEVQTDILRYLKKQQPIYGKTLSQNYNCD